VEINKTWKYHNTEEEGAMSKLKASTKEVQDK
jgi:hypothetical protein